MGTVAKREQSALKIEIDIELKRLSRAVSLRNSKQLSFACPRSSLSGPQNKVFCGVSRFSGL